MEKDIKEMDTEELTEEHNALVRQIENLCHGRYELHRLLEIERELIKREG